MRNCQYVLDSYCANKFIRSYYLSPLDHMWYLLAEAHIGIGMNK